MSEIIFFEPNGPFFLKDLFDHIPKDNHKTKIFDIKTLENASRKDLTFFNSTRYNEQASKTKAVACITKESLGEYLPRKCIKVFVKNVLFSTAKATKKLYPSADLDYSDSSVRVVSGTSPKYKSVTFGKNILIGKGVKIGAQTSIGHNTIIEKKVRIGNNCLIGSNVTLRNTII